MRLGLRVVDAACEPIPDAAVEIWHCDTTGDYSAFPDNGGGKDAGSGTTFLRGTQTAGADGIVEFQTVYPGWYRGRAVHIHVRVHAGGSGRHRREREDERDPAGAGGCPDAHRPRYPRAPQPRCAAERLTPSMGSPPLLRERNDCPWT